MIYNIGKNIFYHQQLENIFSFLLGLLAFIIHPYYVILLVTLLQLKIKINFFYFIPIYIFILSLYWSTRVIGVSWDGGFDDAPAYLDQFLIISKSNFITLISNFFSESFISNTELTFTLLLYFISFLTTSPNIFLFILYFAILIILSYTSFLISKRYFLLILTLIFFGIGAFIEQGALSLLRSTLGSVVFFYGVFLFEKNKIKSIFILFLSCLIHLALIPFYFLVLFIFKTKLFNNYFKLFLFATLIVFILQIFSTNLLEQFGRLNYLYTDQPIIILEVIKYSFILLIYFIYFNFKQLSNPEKISFFLIALITNLYIFFPNFIFMTGRYVYIIQLFIAFLIFKIFLRVKNKNIISITIIFLFIRKMFILNHSEFILSAFPNFIEPFSPFFQIIRHL